MIDPPPNPSLPHPGGAHPGQGMGKHRDPGVSDHDDTVCGCACHAKARPPTGLELLLLGYFTGEASGGFGGNMAVKDCVMGRDQYGEFTNFTDITFASGQVVRLIVRQTK